MNEMGGPKKEPVGLMFGLMIVSRLGQLVHNMQKMKAGKSNYNDTFKD